MRPGNEARVRARRGEYVTRSTSTVADYLAEWAEAHAATVKPKTLAGYRHDIDHYIVPRIGRMRLQALRPAVISKLYRDLVLQQHFVVFGLSSLVVAGFGAVLVASAPV